MKYPLEMYSVEFSCTNPSKCSFTVVYTEETATSELIDTIRTGEPWPTADLITATKCKNPIGMGCSGCGVVRKI